jgi:FkbM family methyltransferase
MQTLRFLWTHPISRRHRCAALWRWLCWQIGSRLRRGPVVWDWIPPAKLVLERGMTGATGNLYCGLHEFADMAFALHFLRPGDGFLDGGANVGSYSVLASALRGARTLAVEPHPGTFAKLQRNLAANGIESLVSAKQAALGPARGSARLTSDRDTMNKVVEGGDDGRDGTETLAVELWPLDELLADFPTALWKLDVEGFEDQVLAGAVASLASPGLRAILIEGVSEGVRAQLLAAGFEPVSYDPFTRRFGDPARARHNALWIRDRAFCESRVQSAEAVEFYGVRF